MILGFGLGPRRDGLSQENELRAALDAVARLQLPDCWIAAGAVRNFIWDLLHDLPHDPGAQDTDVIWFDPLRAQSEDRTLEERLQFLLPGRRWSVKNQAHMHLRNGDRPYRDCADAIRHWPETATAVAARLGAQGAVDLLLPFGSEDLLGLIVRPTPHMATRRHVYANRLAEKKWLARWPRLTICP